MSLTGDIKILFSKDVYIPYFSLEEMKEYIFLDLDLSTPHNYTWEVTEMEKSHITLKIKFDDPNALGLSDIKDSVKVTVNPFLFKALVPEVEG